MLLQQKPNHFMHIIQYLNFSKRKKKEKLPKLPLKKLMLLCNKIYIYKLQLGVWLLSQATRGGHV